MSQKLYTSAEMTLTSIIDGVGISSRTMRYKRNNLSSGVSRPANDNDWSTTPLITTTSERYLWSYEILTFTDGHIDRTTPAVIGIHGETGLVGATGRGIQSQTITYALGDSGETPPLAWLPTVPPAIEGKYQWTRTYTVYTDNQDPKTAYNVSYLPTNGQRGTGVVSSTVKYAQTENGIDTPEDWVDDPPSPEKGFYLWTKTHIQYSDNTSSTAYSRSYEAKDGEVGDQGPKGDDGIVGILTNENHAIPTDADGNYANYTGANTELVIYKGITRDTDNWKITIKADPDITGHQPTDNQYVVTGLTADVAEVIFTAEKPGHADIVKVFTVSKSKQGVTGEDPTLYYLDVDTQYIRYNVETFEMTPATIGVEGRQQKSGIETNADGYFIVYEQADNAPLDYAVQYKSTSPESFLNYEIKSHETLAVKIEWYQDDMFTHLLDRETIPVISNGVSLKDIVNYYLASTASSGITLDDKAQFTKTMQTTNTTKRYLWRYEEQIFTDGRVSYTDPVVIGVHGEKGEEGEVGRSITSIEENYLASPLETGVVRTSGEWKPSVQTTTPTNKYLWNYEKINWNKAPFITYVEPRIIGTHGERGVQGPAGGDAYTVILSNESHTFKGDVNNALADTIQVKVIAYKGATQVAATIGKITGEVNGLTTSIPTNTNNSTNAQFNVNVTTALTTPSGQLTIPITVDGKSFTKNFSFSVAFKGQTGGQGGKGDPGLNAQIITLSSSAQIITKDKSGGITPASIKVTGAGQNISIANWTYSTNGNSNFVIGTPDGVTRSGNTVTINSSQVTARTIAIKAANGSVEDVLSLAVVEDGTKGDKGDIGNPGLDAYTVILSNEAHTFKGDVNNALAETIQVRVIAYKGATQVPADIGSISGQVDGLNATVPTSTNKTVNAQFNVAATTALKAPNGQLTIPITVDGKIFTKYFSFSVAFKGATGESGGAGANAQIIRLSSSAQIIAKDKNNVITPSSITVTGIGQNITIASWTYSTNGSTSFVKGLPDGFTQSGNTVTINSSQVTARTVAIKASNGAVEDVLTIARVEDGSQGDQGEQGEQGPRGATGSQGPRGATGTSVESVTEYYLATSASSDILSSNTGFKTTMQPLTPTNKYLWNYEKINFSDGTSQPTIPVIIGVYGDKGEAGSTGATGRSIVSITEHYLATSASSGVTRSTSGWDTKMQPTTETNKYLWNYETIKWSSGTTPTYVEPIIIGVHGAKGPQGPQGVSITKVDIEYYLSTSDTSLVGGSWSTTAPAWKDGRFMWSKTVTTYSSGDPTESKPVCITGAKGSTGGTGRGITSIVEQFYLSDSKTVEPPTSGWLTNPPTWSPGKYIWTRSLITYTTGTPATSTTKPLVSSEWEAINELEIGGRNLVLNSSILETSGLGATSGSRAEYQTINTGQSYMDLEDGETITISFDIEMKIAKANPTLQVYNSNVPGPVGIPSMAVGNQLQGNVGETINKRISLTTHAVIRDSPSYSYNTLEFYSTYGTDNFFKISKLKVERGNVATDWTPAPEDVEAAYTAVAQAKAEAERIKAESYADGKVTAEEKARIADANAKLAAAKQYAEDQILADKTIKDTRNDNQTPAWYYTNHPRRTIKEFKFTSTIGVVSSEGTYGILETEIPWTDASGGPVKQNFRVNSKTFKRSGTTTSWSSWISYDDIAETAKSDAATAKGIADGAVTSASTANSLLADIASDSVLTPGEKKNTKKEWDIIVGEKPKIDASADTYGITTQKTAYANAYNALNTYLTGPGGLLLNINIKSAIVGTTFRNNFKNYYNARQDLLNKIADSAKLLVDGIEIGGRNLLTETSEEEQEAKTSSWSIGSWNPSLIIGEEYTFSFDIKSENATYLQNVFLNSSNSGFIPNTPISKEWTKVSFTFKWKGGTYNGSEFVPHIYPRPDYSGTYVSRIKLEKGNKATDWTPAPEDIQGDVQGIRERMSESEAALSQITGTIEDISGNISELSAANYMTSSQYHESLQQELANFEADINLGPIRATTDEIDQNFTFSDLGMVVGSDSQKSKVRVANDRIEMINENKVASYIVGGTMFADNFVALQGITLLNHTVTSENNKTVFRYQENE